MRKFLKSFVYAFNGFSSSVRSQLNLRIHLLIAAAVVAAGFYYGITGIEWCILLLCIGMVTSAELFNTSIEQLTDIVHPGHHEKAGKVKDAAAAAVLVLALISVVIGIVIFFPYIIK